MLLFFSLCFLGYFLFSSIYMSSSIIISYGIHPFDICERNPDLWHLIKLLFLITYIFSSMILSNLFYQSFLEPIFLFFAKFIIKKPFSHFILKMKHSKYPNSILTVSTDCSTFPPSLQLYVGESVASGKPIYLSEKSLFQNILITGTIGTGKTSSAMYPFTEQFIAYFPKIPMLILDVKGNYYLKVKELCEKYHRTEDLIVLELNGKFKYNPLHKPHLKASVLADRLKDILLLFSPNNSESYWIDKAHQLLTEAIKLCRLYNNGYVTFEEIHKLITLEDYYREKIPILREKFIQNNFSTSDIYDLYASLHFFEKEFFSLDLRTISILKSEITRITNCFVSDYAVFRTFCPSLSELNFTGFEDALSSGKIIVLNLNIATYKNLSKIIAAYLKLDFQTEVMNRLTINKSDSFLPAVFISDEYSEYCTLSDSQFFSQSREAKCINIVATQSYTSLLNALNNQYAVQVIIQNLVNKLWFRTDDMFTIEDAQKQIGKEDKEKISKSISENAKETNYSYFTRSLYSNNSSISESVNTYSQTDYIYDTKFFTQELENFSCLSFLSNGTQIIHPQKIKLKPYFKI